MRTKDVVINDIRYCEDEILGMKEELEFMRIEHPNKYLTMDRYIEIDDRLDDFEDRLTELRSELKKIG